MASYTLDDIRNAAEAKYASTDIDLGEGRTLRLHNPLRLSKTERNQLRDVQERINSEETDEDVQIEGIREIIRIASRWNADAEELFRVTGDDLALLASVLELYNKGTQAGEA